MIKRLLDIVGSSLGLIFLSPLFFLIAGLIKLTDEGPALFSQVRVGQGGRLFHLKKFRTMVVKQALPSDLTVGADRRITPLGGLLRRFKLDELPQLWNVLKGEMSLVGPRPEIPKFVEFYSEEQRKVLRLKPGITDPASFAFFDESELLSRVTDPERFYREQLIAEKIRINMEYAAKARPTTDMALIAATLARAAGLHFDLFSWLDIEAPKIKS